MPSGLSGQRNAQTLHQHDRVRFDGDVPDGNLQVGAKGIEIGRDISCLFRSGGCELKWISTAVARVGERAPEIAAGKNGDDRNGSDGCRKEETGTPNMAVVLLEQDHKRQGDGNADDAD